MDSIDFTDGETDFGTYYYFYYYNRFKLYIYICYKVSFIYKLLQKLYFVRFIKSNYNIMYIYI